MKGLQISRGMGKWSWTASWTCRLTTDKPEWNSETLVCGLELVRRVQLSISWMLYLLELLLCWEGFCGLESSVNLVGLACLKEEMDISALTLFCEKKMWCLTRMWSCHKTELWSLKWNILNVGNSNNLIMFYFANPMTILVELAEVFQNKGTKQTFSHYLKFPG